MKQERPCTRGPVLALLLALIAVLALAACNSGPALSVYLEANRERLTEPASTWRVPTEFVVEPGTPARAIGDNLEKAGLIKDALLFEAYVRVNGLAGRLEAGTFTLSPDMTIVEIAEALQHALAPNITVAVPEGWRLEQVADFLSAATPIDGTAYRQVAEEPDQNLVAPDRFDFLSFRPANATLEGYLFPSAYQLDAENPTAAALIERQLEAFGERVMPAYWKAVADGATALELHDVLTLASIVEREAVVDAERATIAGVYLNRLARGMNLEADPTVQYAMGFQPETGQWWKTPVFLEEYGQVDSPYNTYLYGGLPPGPIASPGLPSITAVLQPEAHDFLYFVATPDGSGRHVFSRTYEEHLQNVRRYRGQ